MSCLGHAPEYIKDYVSLNQFAATIEFLGIWESLNNPGSNPVEFDGFGAPPRRRPTA